MADNDDLENNSNNIKELNRNIKLSQNITKDEITSALDAHIEVDLRLLSENGRNDIAGEVVNLGGNLSASLNGLADDTDNIIEAVGETPIAGKIIRNTLTSPAEGLIDYFYENDSRVYAKDENENIITIDNANQRNNYAVNGIIKPEDVAKDDYLKQEGRDDLALRHNPTSGFIGDLIESGLGKTLGRILPQTNKMARLVATDYYNRRDIIGANNTHHSQGTIIESNAIKLYNKTYAKGLDLSGNILVDDNNNPLGPQRIDNSQTFNAVGPAISKVLQDSLTQSLDYTIYENSAYQHNKHDSVKRLTAPDSVIDFVKGIIDLPRISDHDVRNYEYSYYLMDEGYKKKHKLPHPDDMEDGYPDPFATLKKLRDGQTNIFNPYGIRP